MRFDIEDAKRELSVRTADGLAPPKWPLPTLPTWRFRELDAVITAPTSRAMWEKARRNPPTQPLFGAPWARRGARP